MTETSENSSKNYRLVHCDSLKLAIAEDRITTIAEWSPPTPLPFAPTSVLGIVCIHGKMFTVLNLSAIFKLEQREGDKVAIVALRGDEQLALAVDNANSIIEISQASLDQADVSSGNLVHCTVTHDSEEYSILNINELFPTILQGRERRRRRF